MIVLVHTWSDSTGLNNTGLKMSFKDINGSQHDELQIDLNCRHHQAYIRDSDPSPLSCCFGLGQFLDLRVAVLGNVDSGKSTLLGVLTQGELDNGRGRARLNLFRHLHEIQTGRTSSISFEILGFNSKGEVRESRC